ncbi:Imm8 family immunity protein [Leisingera sp. ANG-M7]|uniref:Imm8 family immunity protein n=1 Tax=Leisingera sp. ANG-M7 TaxID=1577902 RepID=UPI00057D2B25|nr:Imm8 family immunity protein [Leisingera sp. ANG-M7]KIC35042.1 hypothetical protein RA26_19780 [Leisingera sp. ANG-M7]
MKAEIKQFYLDDYRGEKYWPEDAANFCAIADMNIGIQGHEGGDNFVLTICSPKWFEDNVLKPPRSHVSHEQVCKPAFGRHFLFMEYFNPDEIESTIFDLVTNAEGKDWGDVARYLARFFAWEFEDYSSGVAT